LTIRLIPQNKQKLSILQNSRSSRRLSVLKEESEDSESVRSSNINPSAASSPIQPEYHSNGKVDPDFHPNGKVDPDFFMNGKFESSKQSACSRSLDLVSFCNKQFLKLRNEATK
jgi:hypothetical protein